MAENDCAISIIIPVHHDCDALAGLLKQLAAAAPTPFETIVVDGADSAQCAALCRDSGALRVVTPPGRGHQLNQGAAAARGTVLWFIHADALIPGDCIALIRKAMDTGVAGGYFRFRFAGPRAWHKSALQSLINLRTKVGIPYGDQGLFVARDAFFTAGGFAEAPLFEEVPLVRGLRRQGDFRELSHSIGVSCRRWESDGWLRRSLANRGLALAYSLGVAPEVLARRYTRTDANCGDDIQC